MTEDGLPDTDELMELDMDDDIEEDDDMEDIDDADDDIDELLLDDCASAPCVMRTATDAAARPEKNLCMEKGERTQTC